MLGHAVAKVSLLSSFIFLFACGVPSSPGESPAVASQGLTAVNLVSLSLSPTSISGGSGGSSTALVSLDAPAPAGGVVVTLSSSNPQLAASIPQLTIPAGASSATFQVGTNARYRRYSGLGFSASISASLGGVSRVATLSVTAQPRPSEVVRNPDTTFKGPSCAGEPGILFECDSGLDSTCTFKQECLLGCLRLPANGTSWVDACATTDPFPLSVPQPVAVGGHPIEASLALTAPAPDFSTGHVHSDTIYASPTKRIPFELPKGATSVPVEVFTGEVTAPQFSPLDVHLRTVESDRTVFSTRHARTWVAVVPGAPPALQPVRMTLDVTEPTGGLQFAGTVFINQLAPQSVIRPVTVTLSSSDTNAATTQPSITFSEGSDYGSFGVYTKAVAVDTRVTISATLDGQVLTHSFTVKAAPTATNVESFLLDPVDGVIGGQTSVTGMVTLNGRAPPGGAVVTLTNYESNTPKTVSLPENVTVPEGADRATFPITTFAVAADTYVSLGAYYGYETYTTLLVLPAPGAVTLSSLSLSPTTVTGGAGSTGTVVLSAAAPSGGATVSLSTSNSAVATVPPGVTIAEGATTATFPISTTSVTANTTVTVSGALGGVTRTAVLGVNTAAPPPSLTAPSLLSPADDARFNFGTTIKFDWSDVTGAASYALQIDDSSDFSVPLTVAAEVTVSQYSNSTLPRTRFYWRVRALDAAGVAGPWSAVRRVEVR